MRIRMITFHTPKNYGAVLQAYSLQSYFSSLGYNTEIIDFDTKHLRDLYRVIPKIAGIKSFLSVLLTARYLPAKKEKYQKFDAFVNQNLKLTRKFSSFEQLNLNVWEKDSTFVTGSDQVFNPNRQEDERKAFYLNFAPPSSFKFSYAGSFGVDEINEKKAPEISNYLENFNAISVRESSGVNLVSQLTLKPAVEVMDPVFLNSIDFWRAVEKPCKKIFQNYILYYRLMNSAQSDEAVMKYAHEKHCQLVTVCEGRVKTLRDSILLRNVGPDELLYLIDHSKYVATDSFHGVAFSIIYQKDFLFCDFNDRLNKRGLNLMNKLGIEQTSAEMINYRNVNEKLNRLVDDSKHFIMETLEMATGK